MILRHTLTVAAAIILVLLFFTSAWFATYPSASDPKSIQYLLWKNGPFHITLSEASSAMIGDPKRDNLVIGKTRQEIEARFGRLLNPDEVAPYFRDYYLSNEIWRHKQAAFIKDSNWMILFDHDRATGVILVKG